MLINTHRDNQEKEKKKKKEETKNEDYSSTIFVRNVSYEVGQSEFRDFFKKFGPIDYAKVITFLQISL